MERDPWTPPFPQREALIEGLRHLDSHQLVNLSTTEEVPLDASVVREMPYMSAVAVKAKTGRHGETKIIELDDGKIYRKALYLMVKTMVSCRFSLKPIQ